jgi:hypothetical protein
MNIYRILTLVVFAAGVSGCGPVPLVPVTYEKEVVAQSDLTAFVELNTGRVSGHSSSTMIYAGGIFVPVSTGPVPELQFGAEDQAIFIQSLKDEMQRLGIVGSIADTAADDSLNMVVDFVQTEHFPNFQEYKLTVSLLTTYRGEFRAHRYEVLSSEGDSGWTKWNTNAAMGKEKAATKLMDLLMADIQLFVAEIEQLESDPVISS